jgi:hypothetical protein
MSKKRKKFTMFSTIVDPHRFQFSMRIRIQHFRSMSIRIRIQGFDDPEVALFFIPMPHEERPSYKYRRDLQPSVENIQEFKT